MEQVPEGGYYRNQSRLAWNQLFENAGGAVGPEETSWVKNRPVLLGHTHLSREALLIPYLQLLGLLLASAVGGSQARALPEPAKGLAMSKRWCSLYTSRGSRWRIQPGQVERDPIRNAISMGAALSLPMGHHVLDRGFLLRRPPPLTGRQAPFLLPFQKVVVGPHMGLGWEAWLESKDPESQLVWVRDWAGTLRETEAEKLIRKRALRTFLAGCCSLGFRLVAEQAVGHLLARGCGQRDKDWEETMSPFQGGLCCVLSPPACSL